MNNVTILNGRLGADVDMRADKNGTEYARIRVADDVGYGEKKHTNWWSFTIFGRDATNARQFLCKGSKVSITGRDVKVSTYVANSGETRLALEATCVQFAILSTPGEEHPTPPRRPVEQGEDSRYAPPPMPEQTEAVSDDIPF